MTVDKAKEKLESFKELEKNWDSYGADPIDPINIEITRDLLDGLDLIMEDPYFIAPSPDGGVMIEYRTKGDYEVLVYIERQLKNEPK